MYQVHIPILTQDPDVLADHYLALGALSVSIVPDLESDTLKLWILASERGWFLSVGIQEKPERLKKSAWEYRHEAAVTVQELVPGVVVQAATSEVSGDGIVLRLDLRGAFGDGAHPTTKLCAGFVMALAMKGVPKSLLDLGTGTGVLAILAAKLGVGIVDAMDYDPVSVKRTRRNIRLNQVRVGVRQGDVLSFDPGRRYAVVVANLHSELISQSLGRLKTWVAPGGVLILSGVSELWKLEIRAKILSEGLTILDEKDLNGWCGFVIQCS